MPCPTSGSSARRSRETGINLAIVDNRRTPTEAIDPNIKNFNWMDLQRGLFEALDRGADHAVLCTPAGLLAKAPASTSSWSRTRSC